jgi:hypothetical protein
MPTAVGRPAADEWSATAAWARSGAMGLGGSDELPPNLPPPGLVDGIEALVDEIEELTSLRGHPVHLSWSAALAGRADFMGLHRQGQVSANGSCRLMPTLDGWMALNLPRQDDVELVPALVGGPVGDPWEATAGAAAQVTGVEMVARARLLGLAASVLSDSTTGVGSTRTPIGSRPYGVVDRWSPGRRVEERSLKVVDLSPLWAGPMVARVLAEAGAEVTRIVSTGRHEGAAPGSAFYEWIHASRESRLEVDLRSAGGRAHAARLIGDADVVIEGSRPRALEQLELGPDSYDDRPSRIWLSITGHGRNAPGRDWIAFGDDAAVAGGLVGWDQAGHPAFCGDAIADPLTGLTGSVAVLRALASGGGCLIDLAMAGVAAHMAVHPAAGTGGAALPATVEPLPDASYAVRSGQRSERVRDRPQTIEWVVQPGQNRRYVAENRS